LNQKSLEAIGGITSCQRRALFDRDLPDFIGGKKTPGTRRRSEKKNKEEEEML